MLMIRPLQPEEIGGGRVRTKFHTGGRDRLRGEIIDADEMRTWKRTNLLNLMERGYIECWPKHVTVLHQERQDEALRNPAVSAPSDEGDIRRIVISKGFGSYDVIEGRVLAKGVSKAEAHSLAGIPLEADPPPQQKRPVGRPRKTARPNAPHLRSHASAEPPAMPLGVGPKDDDGSNGPLD